MIGFFLFPAYYRSLVEGGGAGVSQYLLNFAKHNLEGKSEAYLILLWCLYKGYNKTGRYSDQIKSYLSRNSDKIFDGSSKGLFSERIARNAARFKKVLDGRAELDWVAPSGLSALAEMNVKNFRGFGELSADDRGTFIRFGKVKNIFYAPNGGGKTSLCEAIEFGTTGAIKEADRRKTKLKDYIARGSKKQSVFVRDKHGVDIVKSQSWSACFVDRNRLQEFSLLGSKDTGSNESDVVATLFGLEELQDVISKFVRPASFDLLGFLKSGNYEQLARAREEHDRLKGLRSSAIQSMALDTQNVLRLLGIPKGEVAAIRLRYLRLLELHDMKIRVAERLKVAAKPLVFSKSAIHRVISIGARLKSRLEKIDGEFAKLSSAINYQALFEAIKAMGEGDERPDYCPACCTPLDKVSRDPFLRARNELGSIERLTDLKRSKHALELKTIALAARIATWYQDFLDNEKAGIEFKGDMAEFVESVSVFHISADRVGGATSLLSTIASNLAGQESAVDEYVGHCREAFDRYSSSDERVRKLLGDVKKISHKLDEIKSIFSNKKQCQSSYKIAGRGIQDILAKIKRLQELTSRDNAYNDLIRQTQVEYSNLHSDLAAFKVSIEKARISGIEEKAAHYYKEINAHDDEHEQILGISFSGVNGGYRINIKGQDSLVADAFATLSEGHLRVLGLSLLLAMAQKNNLPLIVFDDVVNAIDTEHRANIIHLFFNDPYLKKIQMVVTTHDRLFWERFCMVSESSTHADQSCSRILTCNNHGIVSFDYAGGFKAKIENALEVYDIRQALLYCRIWFETMVVQFCLDNKIQVTATFTPRQRHKANLLQISLEKTFSLVEDYISYDFSNYHAIKRDLINWGAQNQEHHAFDEFSFNFVHSKTSREVLAIYEAIDRFECQLFPLQRKEYCLSSLVLAESKIDRLETKTAGLMQAPEAVKAKYAMEIERLKALAALKKDQINYIEFCLRHRRPLKEAQSESADERETTDQ